ncbi:hypothetical protein [Roseimaritima ulvae]|uniref:Uncharacterized protein n=1 Tax=Roseimaritima ulvae TaxID=980254 RepID=A0A5B9R4S6_9BACT|nr:hypothetical protein [Roseimaritima ulvae]QEG41233.1 hypothetical protein UC8_32520 [Roseimaritima ulvae]
MKIDRHLYALLVLSAWLCASVLIASQGGFRVPLTQPPIFMLGAILAPPYIFCLLMSKSRAVRDYVHSLSPVFLTSVQGLRILGGGFLFLWWFGHLPALFAWPAGWGDVLVAVLAPVVAAAIASDRRFIRTHAFVGFHILGLLDFVGAVGSGLLARGAFGMVATTPSTSALAELPLSLIPGFAVPLWICFHLAALDQRRGLAVSGASSDT